EKLTTDRDRLLTLLRALDTYGEIFACDGGDSRQRIGYLIKAFQAAPKGQHALLDFYEQEGRLAELWRQLEGLRKRWPEIFRIVGPIYRAFDWDPAQATLA